jgi:endonuclease/exonuclease/phosphatase family metal-dependent hydrolase
MSSPLVRVATWNIGGGILGDSHQRDQRPTPDYYASMLKKHSPDLVCLQEAHDYSGRVEGQTEYLARRCGYPYAVSFPVSESHLLPDARLALGILSRFPVNSPEYRQFPNPGLLAMQSNGDRWDMADKGYVRAAIEFGSSTIGLINAHCFPFHYFGASAAEPRFAGIWDMLMRDMQGLLAGTAALVAGDLNHEPVQELLPAVLDPGPYQIAFQNTPTTARRGQQDYILYNRGTRLVTTSVTPTDSDHAYCQVEIIW